MKILRFPFVIGLIVGVGGAFNADAQTETNLFSFGSVTNDGSQPYAGLVQGRDGNFYGTTTTGGTIGYGTEFRISPGGTYTNLHPFVGYPTDGS